MIAYAPRMQTASVRVVSVLAMLAACSKGDDCERFVDKSMPVLADLMKKAGRDGPGLQRAALLEQCRKGEAKKDPAFACVLAAADQAAVSACYAKAFAAYADAGKQSEAKLVLHRIAKNLKLHHVQSSAFPTGKAGPTPPTRCCDGPDKQCAAVLDWTADPVWSKIEFQLDEPSRFQYSYESDGATATVLAVGDLDCDGTAITYTLKVWIPDDGLPKHEIVDPPKDAD